MAPLTATEKAERDRNSIKLLIEDLEKKLAEHSAQPKPLLKIQQYIRSTTKGQYRLTEVHERISHSVEPAEMAPHNTILLELNDRLSNLEYEFEVIKIGMVAATQVATPPPEQKVKLPQDIRLPRLELPTFNGDLNQWIPYRDLFTAAVRDNVSLTKVQKLTYLKSTLTGEPARLVQSMTLTDASYDIAWEQLTNRYQNDRELLFSILNRFYAQPNVQPNSASSIRSLIDVTNESIRSLQALGRPAAAADDFILYTMFQKLDVTSKQLWEQSLKDSSIPAYKDLLDFLESRARSLHAGGFISNPKPKAHNQDGGILPKRVPHVHHATVSCTCKVCSENHFLFKCPKFNDMPVQERYEFIRKNSLCFNCLRDGHSCTTCPSPKTCRKCNKSHHSLLHRESVPSSTAPQSGPQSHHVADATSIEQGLLATALLNIADVHQQHDQVRALMDGGSNVNFVTESLVQRLGISRTRTTTEVKGLGSSSAGNSKGIASVTISPYFNSNVRITVRCLIVPTITGRLPLYPCDPTVWPHLQGLQLADPTYHVPGRIDMLLGCGIFYNYLMDGRKQGRDDCPVGIKSAFGWLIAGNLNLVSNKVNNFHVSVDLDKQLTQFWDIDSTPQSRMVTSEERECESHFTETHQRDDTGRFMVQLPFKVPRPALGPSRDLAVRRLQQLERRLSHLPERKEEYSQFMKDYVSLGHMQLVPKEEVDHPLNPTSYIPHHFVLKDSSTTTKFRVVFDASAKTSSGNSLNDTLMVGPTIQETLVSIMTRFRTHPIAFTADLAKMYRQIRIAPVDTDMQRIVWRDNPKDEIKDYRLLTVTYGTAPAPFLATRALQQLAYDERKSFPLAADVILSDMYVDDLMSGAPTDEAALEIQHQLLELTQRGGFNLRKWSSNSQVVMDALPPELRETTIKLEFDSDQTVKALGVYWNTTKDIIEFQINLDTMNDPTDLTKRTLLSQIAKIFDPLGWLAPTVVRAKILIQQLWKLQLGWDETLPDSIQQEWYGYKNNLKLLEQIPLRRCFIPSGYTTCDLVGFSDASEKAYAAVVYLRASGPNLNPVITLISSKTRVAPTKQVSLPRLELCGALLLAQLMKKETTSLKIKLNNTVAFTDSTVVLAWINAHPSRWKTFVANRVTEIQSLLPCGHWNHVRGEDNPADCASRGVDPAELLEHPLWWTGPNWLSSNEPFTNAELPDGSLLTNLEQKQETVISCHACPETITSLLNHVSSLWKLTRYTAWYRRFFVYLQSRVKIKVKPLPKVGPLTTSELTHSLLTWVRIVQDLTFYDEMNCLQNNKRIPCKSRILSLNPFLDSAQILRVGGRLRNSPLPADQKNPMLLPRHHKFTQLLITDEHLKHFHAGPQMLLSVINRKFWILGARDAIRHQIKKCVVCCRYAASMQQQFMGDLPSSRVTPARAFLKCGVDYAGPFLVKPIQPRSKLTLKAYLAIFICFTTRAVHLELVSSLSTDAFLAAFRRFISRRGKPSLMFSDCGTNFVGAANEIKQFINLINSASHNNVMTLEMSKDGVTWNFNPPGAPHFGGLWEAGVKSVKYHLHRVVGSSRLTFEELTTILTQVEACLNSRPLTPMSSDPNDLMALTPGHFLIGGPLTALPDPDLTSEKTSRLSRWQHLQQMTQHFWRRWSNEFVARMQQRPKWLNTSNKVQLNSLVLIKDERLPPLKWKMGRVIRLHPGPDGIVRVVTLKTTDGEIQRPIVKVCLLPIDCPSESE